MTKQKLAAVGAALIVFAIAMTTEASATPAAEFDRHASDGRGFVAPQREARRVHHKRDRRIRPAIPRNYAGHGLVTVATAAGINITVAPSFAPKIQGFIADLVARGYRPSRIRCHARGGHVRGSFHYSGEACDFNQRGWGKTDGPMYRVADLAAKHGLRDGCTFRDCGHIDAGTRYARASTPRRHRYAAVQ